MPNDPAYISLFNEAQFSITNDLSRFDALAPGQDPWLGELTPDEGEFIAGAILVGPFHAGSMTTPKTWEMISFKGEGRVMVLVWIDDRLVAKGKLTLGRNTRKTNRLKLPRGNRTGASITALVILHGRLLEIKSWWTPEEEA